MSISPALMTDDQLLQNFAIHKDDQTFSKEIVARIERSCGRITKKDQRMIKNAVGLLAKIEEIEEPMGISLSNTERELSRQYLEIIKQLLQRMQGKQQKAVCQTI